MRVKFVAKCEVPYETVLVKDHIERELRLALGCLERRFPSESTMSHLTVESSEVIPDTDPQTEKQL